MRRFIKKALYNWLAIAIAVDAVLFVILWKLAG